MENITANKELATELLRNSLGFTFSIRPDWHHSTKNQIEMKCTNVYCVVDNCIYVDIDFDDYTSIRNAINRKEMFIAESNTRICLVAQQITRSLFRQN